MSELQALAGFYDSYEWNLDKDFYIPMFRTAKKVDRVSCYFSSKALALYARGLEEFAKKPSSKYRLLVSEEVSPEDFDAMLRGEISFESHDDELVRRMREDLTLDESNSVEMLVRLMSLGIVEMKIALVRKGLFHSKWAYVEGYDGESMLMLGSNNETAAAVKINYEEFDFREYRDDDRHREKFEALWNNEKSGIVARYPSELIQVELNGFLKTCENTSDIEIIPDNCIHLGITDGELVFENRLDDPPSNYSIVYKSKIRNHIKSSDECIVFKEGLNYVDYRIIVKKLTDYCQSNHLILHISESLNDYIESHDLIIEKRRRLGLDIKNRNKNLVPEFEEYKEVLNTILERKLYDRQMWDSFFMYSMKKAGNFSVPGSGKTASVLGVFAFLKKRHECNKLVIICPLNSFDSWITEYEITFGHPAKAFDARGHSGQSGLSAFYKEYSISDIILINYQSLRKYANAIDEYLASKCLLVFDEGHYIKGWSTQRTEAAKIVSRNAVRTLILTGTPIPNSYADLYSLLNILFPKEYQSYFRYDLSTLEKPDITMVEDINDRIQPFYCRTSKKELGIVPPLDDLDFYYDSTQEEIELYNQIQRVCSQNPLSLIVRILQAESDPRMLLNEKISEEIIQSFEEIPMEDNPPTINTSAIELMPTMSHLKPYVDKIGITSKTKGCVDLVKSIVSEGKTVIVWCIFRKSIENLSSMIHDSGIDCRIIDGSTPYETRTKIITDFKSGEFSVLITNPHTLAESVSLHSVCHDTIYFEYSYNLVHLLQSKDRIHRLGLKDNEYTQHRFLKVRLTNMNDPSASKSLDDEIYQRLAYKEDVMNQAIESGTLEITGLSSEDDIKEIFAKMGWKTDRRNVTPHFPHP